MCVRNRLAAAKGAAGEMDFPVVACLHALVNRRIALGATCTQWNGDKFRMGYCREGTAPGADCWARGRG